MRRAHAVTDKVTLPYPPRTNGQAERMVRMGKIATVKALHYETLPALAAHLAAFVTTHDFARPPLKVLRWRMPFHAICDARARDPTPFKVNPQHLFPGPHSWPFPQSSRHDSGRPYPALARNSQQSERGRSLQVHDASVIGATCGARWCSISARFANVSTVPVAPKHLLAMRPTSAPVSEYAYVGGELNTAALAARWKRYFADLLTPYLHGRVLEVGAGMGETMRALLHPGVTEWVSVEPDARLASQIANVALPGRVTPEVIVGDIRAVAPGREFDAIVYIDVLEHIAADRDELAMASRHLRPGGRLIVLAPAFQLLYSAFDKSIGHERRYTRRTLTGVFPPQLVRERVFYADSVGLLLSLGNRLLLHQQLPTRHQVLFWDRVLIPISRVLDRMLGRRVGRSVVAIYRRPRTAP